MITGQAAGGRGFACYRRPEAGTEWRLWRTQIATHTGRCSSDAAVACELGKVSEQLEQETVRQRSPSQPIKFAPREKHSQGNFATALAI